MSKREEFFYWGGCLMGFLTGIGFTLWMQAG